MIGYTTIGVKDIEASKKFYTELFDAEVLVDAGRLAMIGKDISEPKVAVCEPCLLYTSPSPRDRTRSRMPSSA